MLQLVRTCDTSSKLNGRKMQLYVGRKIQIDIIVIQMRIFDVQVIMVQIFFVKSHGSPIYGPLRLNAKETLAALQSTVLDAKGTS